MFERRASASLRSWAGILLFRYLLSDYSGLREDARARARDIDGAPRTIEKEGGRGVERVDIEIRCAWPDPHARYYVLTPARSLELPRAFG